MGVEKGSDHNLLGRTTIPLALSPDSSTLTTYKGPTITKAPIYKVNGNFWTVTFDTYVGDVSPLSITPTSFLSSGVTLDAIDDVVKGEEPLSHSISGIQTGIEYFSRVQAYTRGVGRGYGPYKTSTSAIAATKPSIPQEFSSIPVIDVPEIQELVLGATHTVEIQNVTTTATSYNDIQEIVVKSAENSLVYSNITLRFPEIQVVKFEDASDFAVGEVKLRFQRVIDSTDVANKTDESTACIPVTATAAFVESKLEELDSIDDVEVSTTINSGYTTTFGYEWKITFVGNNVTGDVETLTIVNDGSCTAPANSVTKSVETINEDKIVGLDTEIQVLHVTATDFINEGQYSLKFDNEETGCIEWGASDVEVASNLNGLKNIDKVYIERSGAATSAGVDYTHSVYFVGNAMHLRDQASADALPTVEFNLANPLCKSMKHFVGGNLTVFKSHEIDFSSEVVRSRGYSIVPTAFEGLDLQNAMVKMPSFLDIFDARRSLPTGRQGYKWTINFDLSMGNAASLVCGQIPGAPTTQSCMHYDIVDGNYISGYFILDNTKFMAADVSAADMEAELELLADFGDISVSRTGPTPQNGFTWMITWMTSSGDKPNLRPTNTLLGSGTSILVSEVQKGNYLGGTYELEYGGVLSSDIAFDASANDLKSAITNMTSVGAVNVTESVFVSIEGGKTYDITFIGLSGDVKLLSPEVHPDTFSGYGGLVRVFEKRKGSTA